MAMKCRRSSFGAEPQQTAGIIFLDMMKLDDVVNVA